MTQQTELEVLMEVERLFSDPARWCAGSEALNELSLRVDPKSREARKWCAVGAVRKFAAPRLAGRIVSDLDNRLLTQSRKSSGTRRDQLWRVNDAHGRLAVLELIAERIKELKADLPKIEVAS